ncbi:uncharacterized protein LOC133785210 [Humulus lupulus]|uniref:uncharacterized protein LOC133785210 n=1 Tax=Humulus lupulus TaxID=3486 RepID=UPI002B40B92F|nr:uncharacterized protein LOC133785210 [Humulus lupulus]
MREHNKALLQLPYGKHSLSYLLHEDKLRARGLLEQDQSMDNIAYRKYTMWEHAFASFSQLNYKLNNEVHSSMSYTQESKNLQIKLADELKATKSKLEAEIKEKDSKIKELEEKNAKLEEDKKATFDIIEGEKARLLEEFKQKKDHAINMAMYRIWANNANLDTSFLDTLEDEFLSRWQARLEAEDAEEEAEKAKEKSDAVGGDAPAS